ncbi:MAG TPA: hypothetical protein VGL38_09485 [bacterium]|jgi:hypothetical protein
MSVTPSVQLPISFETLLGWCRPVAPDRTFFRPFTCEGDINNIGIFYVGFSPKNPIPEVTPLEEVAKSCYDYLKLKQLIGASSTSRGRFEELTRSLSISTGGASVLETNAYCYPGLDKDSAKQLPYQVEQKCRKILLDLFRLFHPRWVIIFGKEPVKRVSEVLSDAGMTAPFAKKWNRPDYGQSIVIDLAKITLDGKPCRLIATRHPGDQVHGGHPYTPALFESTAKQICDLIEMTKLR